LGGRGSYATRIKRERKERTIIRRRERREEEGKEKGEPKEIKEKEKREKEPTTPSREKLRNMSSAEFREFLIKEEEKFDDKLKEATEKRDKIRAKEREFGILYNDTTIALQRLRKDPNPLARDLRSREQLTEEERKEYDRLSNEQSKYNFHLMKYTEKRQKADAELTKLKEEHTKERREWFEINPGEGISLNVIMSPSSTLQQSMESTFKPQKEFLERVFAKYGGSQTIQFSVEGMRGSGGQARWREGKITVGTYSSGTTPIHEYTHMVEHMSQGFIEERHKKAVELFERKLGKPLEEIELRKWVQYVDVEGKKHYGKGTGGDYVFIPKDIQFASPQEESEFGYMFRVYRHQTVEKGRKRYIKRIGPSEPYSGGFGLGEEILSVASEQFYTNPKGFAKSLPDVFDFAFEMFRKR